MATFDSVPMVFDSLYGLEMGEITADHITATCPVTPKILQPWGIVHGGVFCSMAETIASVGTYLGVKDAGNLAAGMSNKMSRTTWVWDVEITNDDGALCAIGRLTIAVRPQP
jgi:1,4-dihydroxy-2-naphthoyl-CoA hydrolase